MRRAVPPLSIVAGSERPLVSILTPSYNQARWIRDNLESVACQTYPETEHVVIDGGSTDGTVAILEHAGPDVVWRSGPDQGQADALNKAFAESRGEIIGWINSDDAYYDCRVVEDVVRFFKGHPGVDVAYGHAARVNAEGKIAFFIHVPPFSRRRLRWKCFLVQPSVFMRRSVLGGVMADEDFHYALDWELWLRLAAEGRRFRRMDRVLAIDRTHPQRKIMTWGDVLAKDTARLTEAYGVGRPPHFRLIDTPGSVLGRFAVARFAFSAKGSLAFTGEQDPVSSILRRQLVTRLSKLPAEYR